MASVRFPSFATLTGSVLLLTGCGGAAPIIDAESLGVAEIEPTAIASCEVSEFTVDTIARGLETPWDVAFLTDGTAFVSERAGRVLRFPGGGTDFEPWLDVEVYSPVESEVGLMGVDVSPDGRWLYLSATESAPAGILPRIGRRVARAFDPERGHYINLTVLRAPVSASIAGTPPAIELERVLEPVPAGFIHGGGALRFGPDGTLFLTNGDGGDSWRAQVSSSFRGKLFRFEATAPDVRIDIGPESFYAAGIRHSQGIAWSPGGHLLVIDHGPSGLDSEQLRTDHDELNVVKTGDNLGWPIVAGTSDGGLLRSPLHEWTPALAPAGLAWFDGPRTRWDSSVFVTGLRGARLVRLAVADDPEAPRVTCQENLLESSHGRLRLVRQAPDGSLWVGTSNRDGRGVPRGTADDMILRLTPAPGS